MTKSLRLLTLAVVCAIAAPGVARAQGFITPFIGYNFGGDSANCLSFANCDQKRANFGVSIGSMGGTVGFEEDISWAKNFFGDAPGTDNSVLSLMSSILVGVPGGPVRPYVLGGVGLIHPHVSSSLSNAFDFSKNAFGYDLGGGVHVMFGHIGVRGDVRRFKTMSDVTFFGFTGQKLSFWRASLGLTLGM